MTDLKSLDSAALQEKVIEGKRELMNLRFQRATGQLEKTHGFSKARKMIARAKTLLRQQKDR